MLTRRAAAGPVAARLSARARPCGRGRCPNHTATPWRTFAAHRMQAHALLMHLQPSPRRLGTASGVAGKPADPSPCSPDSAWASTRVGSAIEDVLNPELDNRVTTRLDDVAASGFLGRGARPRRRGTRPAPGRPTCTARGATTRRPEEEHDYHERPVPGAKAAPVDQARPDFHARASLLGDLSPLLRRLGWSSTCASTTSPPSPGWSDIQAHLDVPDLANADPCSSRAPPARSWAAASTRSLPSADYDAAACCGSATSRRLPRPRPRPRRVARSSSSSTCATCRACRRWRTTATPVTSAPSTCGQPVSPSPASTGPRHSHDRLDGAAAKDAALVSGFGEALRMPRTITRGVRLEVWDDVSGVWHSLHRRRLDVEVEGAGEVLTDEPDAGFLQGASLTSTDGVPDAPANAHEVLAGWDGWSLSAPRPGKVVVHEDGEERVVDAPDVDPDPVNPVASSTRVEPGTLPRLRYGRQLRVPCVDGRPRGQQQPAHGRRPRRRWRRGWWRDAGRGRARRDRADRGPRRTWRTSPAKQRCRRPRPRPAAQRWRRCASALRETPPDRSPGTTVRASGADRRRTRHEPSPGTRTSTGSCLSRRADTAAAPRAAGRAITRDAALQDAFATHAMTGDHLLERLDAQTPAAIAAAALVSAALSGPARGIAVLVELADLLTTPRPFLRWEPVLEPTVVPRHPYSEGESQLALAIRSGVDLPATPGDAARHRRAGRLPGSDERSSPGAGPAVASDRAAPPRAAQGEPVRVRAARALRRRDRRWHHRRRTPCPRPGDARGGLVPRGHRRRPRQPRRSAPAAGRQLPRDPDGRDPGRGHARRPDPRRPAHAGSVRHPRRRRARGALPARPAGERDLPRLPRRGSRQHAHRSARGRGHDAALPGQLADLRLRSGSC